MGKVVKKIAPIALPIAGMMIPGVNVIAGAALGGFAGGLVGGQGLKGALISGATAGITAGVTTGGFSNPFKAGGFLGPAVAGAGPTTTGAQFMAGRGFTGVSHLSNIGTGMAKLGVGTGVNPASIMGQNVATTWGQAGGGVMKSGGALNLGRDAMFARTQQMQANLAAASGAGGPTASKAATTLGQTEGSSKILGFDRDKIEEMVGAGFSAYEGDIRQAQIDALDKNLGTYQSQFADFYAKKAKEEQEKLARGELPDTYTAALDREKDRLTRLMIAQGHNPAEAGRGAEEVIRGTMDLEQKFIGAERDYWSAIGGGADTMTAEIAKLRMLQANELRARETTLGELGTSVVGGLLGNKPKSDKTGITINV